MLADLNATLCWLKENQLLMSKVLNGRRVLFKERKSADSIRNNFDTVFAQNMNEKIVMN